MNQSSEGRDFSTDNVYIYVKLLDEGTIALRPVPAVRIAENLAKILKPLDFDPEEMWEFPVKSTVVIETRTINGEEVLVAVDLNL